MSPYAYSALIEWTYKAQETNPSTADIVALRDWLLMDTWSEAPTPEG